MMMVTSETTMQTDHNNPESAPALALGDILLRKVKQMNVPSIRSTNRILGILLAGSLTLAPGLFAQQQQAPPKADAPANAAPAKPAPAKPAAVDTSSVDPDEQKAYKAFYDTKPEASDQQIKLGEAFLQKYPTSVYTQSVYSRLVAAYYDKQDMTKLYAASDKALALNPKDVHVLVLVGWVIPHFYDPNDMDADRRLDKAESYEKQALEYLPTMPKPDGTTDDQFAKAKATAESQAHSALGLIYFRRQDFANSVSEMQKATAGQANADPVDFYVMGVGQFQLKHYSDAGDSFHKCAQSPGAMQDRCKSKEADAKKQPAAQPKP
jgi:tetratricopeptide (TPR) repeat protein